MTLTGAVLLAMGATISWAAPACNNPIFAEIVPPELRNLVYAFDRSFEMAIAAMAAPLVGILAEQLSWCVRAIGTKPCSMPQARLCRLPGNNAAREG